MLLKSKTVRDLTIILRDCGAAGFGETLWGDILRRELLSNMEYECQDYDYEIPYSLEWEKPEEEALDLEPCQAPVSLFSPDGREDYLTILMSFDLWLN